MKALHRTCLPAAISILLLTSCKLDTYDGPNATIHGVVKDVNGGALIEQDVEAGSKIIFREHGFQNPEEQQMIFKVNGEYRNTQMFSATYDFYFNESNFVKPDTIKSYNVKMGDNQLDFTVQPYIRVTGVSIVKTGNEIVATFTITPSVTNNVKQIGLFGHIDRIAGNQFALQRATRNIDAASKDTPVTYTLRLSTNGFTAGKSYFFRVGGLIDVANAKYNYAPAVSITI